MSLETRIEAGGRRLLSSPLYVGLLITTFLVAPTFLVPSIPLWIAITSLLTLTPLVLFSTYLVYYFYGRISAFKKDESSRAEERDPETPLARLRKRYATGEIDEETFERKLDRLVETESFHTQTGSREREVDRLNN